MPGAVIAGADRVDVPGAVCVPGDDRVNVLGTVVVGRVDVVPGAAVVG